MAVRLKAESINASAWREAGTRAGQELRRDKNRVNSQAHGGPKQDKYSKRLLEKEKKKTKRKEEDVTRLKCHRIV